MHYTTADFNFNTAFNMSAFQWKHAVRLQPTLERQESCKRQVSYVDNGLKLSKDMRTYSNLI